MYQLRAVECFDYGVAAIELVFMFGLPRTAFCAVYYFTPERKPWRAAAQRPGDAAKLFIVHTVW
jgi:hypothetical protein